MWTEMLEDRVLLSRTWVVSLYGNDRNAGTVAAPLRTIQAAANAAGPGDTVMIRGGTYRETVVPARSGTPGAPITFEPYPGEHVVVSGADPIGGWSRYNGAVYGAQMAWDLGEDGNQVFVDGRSVNEARWPNGTSDLSHPATALVSSAATSAPATSYLSPATVTIDSPTIPGPAGAWVGATIHIASGQGWVVQTGTVLASSAGQVVVSLENLTSLETPTAGNRFYLTGAFRALDAAGEWYRDPTTGRLYVWDPASDNPANHDVEARRRQFAFELTNRSYINVQGINLFAATIDTNAASSHLTLEGLSAQYVSQSTLNPVPWDAAGQPAANGILLLGTYNRLADSTIAFSTGAGVYVGGSGNTVQDCTIHDVDDAGGGQGAITVSGANQQVLGNTIYNAGRSGILDTYVTASLIEHNTIHDVGIQTTDLGGIYDWGTDGGGTQVAYNTVYNVRSGGYGGSGIYLDNGSSNFIVHDNVIWGCDHAFKVNFPAYNDTFYNNRTTGTSVWDGGSGATSYGLRSAGNVIDFGTFGGFRSVANAINDRSETVGQALGGQSAPGFLFSSGRTIDIGTLGGTYSSGNAINNLGQVAGSAYALFGGRRAVIDAGGRMTNLGTLAGDVGSFAAGINDHGLVVGTSYDAGAVGHAFVYSGGRMSAVGTLGGAISMAAAINNNGQIVGSATLAGNLVSHAYLDTAGVLRDLGTLGGANSTALAINARGQVVGESQVRGSSAYHAFLYANGQMKDLGTLAGLPNSVATAINANGDVVGYAWGNDGFTYRAFLYRNGAMYDLSKLLPRSGWTFQTANGINDSDEIVGSGINPAGAERAFLTSV